MKNTFITISKIVLIMAIPLVLMLFLGTLIYDFQLTSLIGTVPLIIINHIVYLIYKYSGNPKSIKNLSLTLFALTLTVCIGSVAYGKICDIFINILCNIILLFYYVPFVFFENEK